MSEAATRLSADTQLQSNIDTVGTNLANETTRATTAETGLQANISAEQNARVAADNAEANARAAADSALSNRIDGEANARVAADNRLRDEVASSTATAIALGGNAILPDKNFTLSGNVGFYRGATAIALNVAARVSPNTYVTGAFGGGLNKHGQTGGRVGVVFGF